MFTHMLNFMKHFFFSFQFYFSCCENAALVTRLGSSTTPTWPGLGEDHVLAYLVLGSVVSKKSPPPKKKK